MDYVLWNQSMRAQRKKQLMTQVNVIDIKKTSIEKRKKKKTQHWSWLRIANKNDTLEERQIT